MTKQINILFSITSLSNGGAEKQMIKHLYFLSKNKNFKIHLIILRKDYFNETLLPEEIIIHKFNISLLNLSELNRLKKLILQINPKTTSTWLIHSNILIGLFVKKYSKSNLFWNLRGEFLPFNFLSYLEFIFSYFLPNKIVTNSNYLKNHYLSHNYRNIFITIYNSFNPPKNVLDADFVFQRETKIIKVLYNARFVPSKNHDFLFRFLKWYNLKHVIQIELSCIGKDVTLKNMRFRNLLNHHDVFNQVKVLEPVTSEYCLNEIYNSSDICFLLSKSEGFPNVIVEAILNKVFVLCANFGSANEILFSKECILEKMTFENIAKIINNVYLNKSKKLRIINNNYNYVLSNFNNDLISVQLNNLYGD